MTLSGQVEQLRERQLGVDVFGREPGYETSADPVVRMAAGEVRKRLAQHYASLAQNSAVRISLPLGSYCVEFRFAEIESSQSRAAEVPPLISAAPPVLSQPADPPVAGSPRMMSRSRFSLIVGVLGFLVVGLIGGAYWRARTVSPFFRGISAPSPTIVVLGQLPQADATQSVTLPLGQDIFRSDDAVTIEGATSAVAVCSALTRVGGSCSLREATRITLADLQNRPVILFGAYNNNWALRMTQELPFRFGPLDCKCIVERATGSRVGTVDFSLPRDKIFVDYSVVARFQSQVTDGPVLVVAGVGPMSTQAAADYVSAQERTAEIVHLAPRGWKGGNFELVLGTDVVGGVPGHTSIVRAAFW
ncbi:hypothetical protein [Terriglobus roseus]|uniref:Uncharacterized protein n=1 Tax=Terriglobus roseus TaxID=392734 RepID=A0A1H4JXM8_9BACT|nr:hypothetical protein [Terriglobus roseus]SEB50907.1 hypothetical protein SAMN05443244_0877 [Terriglobus roseus]